MPIKQYFLNLIPTFYRVELNGEWFGDEKTFKVYYFESFKLHQGMRLLIGKRKMFQLGDKLKVFGSDRSPRRGVQVG